MPRGLIRGLWWLSDPELERGPAPARLRRCRAPQVRGTQLRPRPPRLAPAALAWGGLGPHFTEALCRWAWLGRCPRKGCGSTCPESLGAYVDAGAENHQAARTGHLTGPSLLEGPRRLPMEAPNGSAAKSSSSERTRNPRRVQEGDKHADLCSAPPQGACRASRAEAAANGNWLGSETPGGTGCLSRDPLAEAAGGDEGGSCRHQPRAQDCWETITMGGRAAAADAPRRPSAAGGASEGDFAGGWRSSGSREEREPAVPESTPPPRAPCDEKRDRCHRHHRRRGLGGGRTRRPS